MPKSVPVAEAAAPPEKAGALTASALFTAIAGIVLVDAEILAVAGTAIYALSAALGAGPVGLGVIATLIGLPTLWLCWQVARLAIAGEREAMDGGD